MDRRILVAYDGRDGGADALALGAQLAETLSAPLLLGSVFPAVRYHATIVAAGEFERQLRAEAEAQLATAVEGLGATGDVARVPSAQARPRPGCTSSRWTRTRASSCSARRLTGRWGGSSSAARRSAYCTARHVP
jgi:hypothetical protein